MNGASETDRDTVEFFVPRSGQVGLRVPRHLEHAIATALKSNKSEVGPVVHRLQESAEGLTYAMLTLQAVADLATVVQLILSVRAPDAGAPRLRYRRRHTSVSFEADGYDDPTALAKLVRALQDDSGLTSGS